MPTAPTPLQTEAGKSASSRNATRHGIGASVLLLEPAEQAFLADLRAPLLELHEPWNAAEMAVVHEPALLKVRRRRLDELELRVLSAPDGPPEPDDRLPSLATLVRYRQRIAAEETAAHARIAELREYRRLLLSAIERGLPAPESFDTHEPKMVDSRADGAVTNTPATNEPEQCRLEALAYRGLRLVA